MKLPSLFVSATALTLGMAFISPLASAESSASSTSSVSSASSRNACGRIDVRCRNNYNLTCVGTDWTCVPESKTPSNTCVAACPDGYKYPTCDANGHVLFRYGDPCTNHEAYAPASTSCSGPNPLTCARGTAPACVNNQWMCGTSSDSASSEGPVMINTVTPHSTFTGKNVLVEGKGFSPRTNIVMFADSVIPNVGSVDGKHLVFRIPPATIRPCYLTRQAPCTAAVHTYTAGTYAVWVKVGANTSNALTIVISTR